MAIYWANKSERVRVKQGVAYGVLIAVTVVALLIVVGAFEFPPTLEDQRAKRPEVMACRQAGGTALFSSEQSTNMVNCMILPKG